MNPLWSSLSQVSSGRNEIETIYKIMKNSKNLQDENRKNLRLSIDSEKNITRVSWGAESMVDLPIRDLCLQKDYVPRVHLKDFLD